MVCTNSVQSSFTLCFLFFTSEFPFFLSFSILFIPSLSSYGVLVKILSSSDIGAEPFNHCLILSHIFGVILQRKRLLPTVSRILH
jgi:hypothetical protein